MPSRSPRTAILLAEGLKLLRFARAQRDIVAIPMGDLVMPLRLLSAREGGAFTYAPIENATAPGQVSLDEALALYRTDKIDRSTQVYGVIGNPIGHSLSPVMQNAGFQARHKNAVYFPFLVHDLKDFIRAIRPLGIRGFSVTIPHKENILRYLDGCERARREDRRGQHRGRSGNGKLYGYNTDYVGVLRTLQTRISLENSRVLILGAGGAARAVAFALGLAGTSVFVYARRIEKAKQLARTAGCHAIERKYLRTEFFDAIVNATPVGMHPRTNESPLTANELNCRLVFDTIYRPRQTKLLQLAAHRGIQIVSGSTCLWRRAPLSGKSGPASAAPEDIMRRAVVRALEREEKTSRRQRLGGKSGTRR